MLIQLIVSGVMQGAIYALVALSMTFIYRATTVLNFGHGDLIMAGAFAIYVLVAVLGIPYLPATLLAIGLLFLMGVGLQHGLIRPLQKGPHVGMVMMTIAAGFLLRSIAQVIWGRSVLSMPMPFDVPPIFIGNIILTGTNLLIAGVVLVTTTIFFIVLYRTPVGKRVQAVYQTQRGSSLVGINVPVFSCVMWGVGAAMGAVGGALLAPITQLYPDMGEQLLVRGFAAMALGGFGSLWGAVVGGVVLGVMENLAGAYINTALIDITAYIIIIIVLIVRPTGIFGRATAVRV